MSSLDVTVILAAGAGTRLGGTGKALVRVNGQTLAQRAIHTAEGAGTVPLLVLGHRAEEVQAKLTAGTVSSGLQILVCRDWEQGLSASLAAGVNGAAALGAERVAVVLVDQPGISAAALSRLLDTQSPGRIARGSVHGRSTHPVVFEVSAALAAAAQATGDQGAREYLRTHSGLVDDIDITEDADDADIDTVEDLLRWRQA